MSGTPGPWEVRDTNGGCEIRMGTALDDAGVYEPQHVIRYEHGWAPHDLSWEQQAEAISNRDLLAAAPKMLEALRDLRDVVRDDLLPKVSGEGWLADEIRVQSVFRQVDVAIAAAEGQQAREAGQT